MSARRLVLLLLTSLVVAACADAAPPREDNNNASNNSAANNNPANNNPPNNNPVNNSSNNSSNNSQNNPVNNNPGTNNNPANNNPVSLCEPNPCTAPPNAACEADGVTQVTYAATGTCAEGDGAPVCTYAETRVSCDDSGQLCQSGRCVDAPLPKPGVGEVVFTEVLFDPHFDLSENTAEWFEVTSVAGETLDLSGCTVSDAAGPALTLENLTLDPAEVALFVRSDNTAANGGLTPDHLFGFALGNDGDTLTLTCDGRVVDQITWGGAGFPRQSGRAVQVDPGATSAAGNDEAEAWCLAPTPYYSGANGPAEDNYGTPGQPNPVCPVPDVEVDWCRFQAPAAQEVLGGTAYTAYGRVFEEGLTDQSDGVDASPELRAELGFGARGSTPGDGWTWAAATPNPGWSASAALPPEPGNDEYQATVAAPAPGMWDVAFRFSRNGGAWRYCDLDARAQGAGDGAADGYSPDHAARLTTLANPCSPNPCAEAPDAECSAQQVATRYTAPGICSLDAANRPVCDFMETTEDCAADGLICMAGECVDVPLPTPASGEVIFSEIFYNPEYNLTENGGEWLEILNTTAGELSLEGCTLVDAGTNSTALNLSGLTIPAQGTMLFARSAVAATNGGITPARTFTFSLNNDTDTLTLRCGGQVIDAVTYTHGAQGFPAAAGYSIQLDPSQATAAANDSGSSWCRVGAVYYRDPEGQDLQDQHGTPGAANPPCAPAGRSVGWCRYQYRGPEGATLPVETPLTVYARVFIEGLTELTPGVDPDPFLVAQAGYGPRDSHPGMRADTVGWTWHSAVPTPNWSGPNSGEAPNDEYTSSYAAPATAGDWELAFRYSIDGGLSWLYCDRDARPTRGDGAADGYNVLDADKLTTE